MQEPPQQGQPEIKAAAALARRIEDEILEAGWPVGKRLGSERELIERYGVSRSVLREAIRLLEHHQVATTREGRGGGLVVTAPQSDVITRAIELYLQYKKVTLGHLLETKRAIELAGLPVAVARLDQLGVERLMAASEAEDAQGEAVFDVTDANIHILLADLSGNPATRVFVEVLTRLSARMVERQRAVRNAPHAFEVHREIAEAVIESDVRKAQRLMAEHLDAIEASGMMMENEDPQERRLTRN